MKIYVINLDRAPERMINMDRQLSYLNLHYHRISAVDGTVLDVDESIVNKAQFEIRNNRKCTAGELGCAESHRLVWKKIINSGESHGLVLEDDVNLAKDLSSLVDAVKNDNFFDIINLSSTGSYPITSEKINCLLNINLRERPYIKGRKYWRRIEAGSWKIFSLKQHGCITLFECAVLPPLTSGYIVSARACIELLKVSENLSFPIDYAFRFVGGSIRQAFSYPISVPQDDELDTSIGNRAANLEFNLYRRVIAYFYKKRNFRHRLSLFKMYGLKYLI